MATQQAGVIAAYLQAAVALVVGLIQAGVVGSGIRYMARMGERREQQYAERHAEAMLALRTLIERTSQGKTGKGNRRGLVCL